MWEREECLSSNAFSHMQSEEAEFDPLCYLGSILTQPPA
jgi:hypothetical protein